MAPSTLAALARRVAHLEATEEVRRTLCRYLYALDAGRWDEQAQVFAPDAILEIVNFPTLKGTYHGRKEIRGFYSALAPDRRPPFWHRATNLSVQVDGDEAHATSYWDAVSIRDGKPFISGGVYQHLMRRVNGRWRIAHKRIINTWGMGWAEGPTAWSSIPAAHAGIAAVPEPSRRRAGAPRTGGRGSSRRK